MIRPEDIQSKEFDVKMRGYDRDQVDDFLDELIDDMSALYSDNSKLTQMVQQLQEELADFRARQTEIDKSLELTKYQCDEMKKNAQLEAKQIIDRAHNDADSALHNVENSKVRMKAICTELLDKLNNM